MKKIILCLVLSSPLLTYAQKVKHDGKTNQVTVDGSYSFKVERSGCGFGMVDCHFDVHDTSGNKVIRVNYKEFKSITERNAANPQGIVRYYEFVFLEAKSKAEIAYPGIKEERIAKIVAENKLIVNGKLDEKAVSEFILVHGTPFSERVKL